ESRGQRRGHHRDPEPAAQRLAHRLGQHRLLLRARASPAPDLVEAVEDRRRDREAVNEAERDHIEQHQREARLELDGRRSATRFGRHPVTLRRRSSAVKYSRAKPCARFSLVKEHPRVVIVDGTNSLYRAFFAIPKLRTADGTPTNA